MGYSELIKDLGPIRSYMRHFIAYGFQSRSDFKEKSPRSYDNMCRRLESWLGDYMIFHRSATGKAQFISVDPRTVTHDPLYRAFKAKSFTDNDIILHFFILDLLADTSTPLSLCQIVEALHTDYFQPVGLVSACSGWDHPEQAERIRRLGPADPDPRRQDLPLQPFHICS